MELGKKEVNNEKILRDQKRIDRCPISKNESKFK